MRELIGIHVLELDRPALDSIITRTQGTLESVCAREAVAVVIVRETAWEVRACGLCWEDLHSVGDWRLRGILLVGCRITSKKSSQCCFFYYI